MFKKRWFKFFKFKVLLNKYNYFAVASIFTLTTLAVLLGRTTISLNPKQFYDYMKPDQTYRLMVEELSASTQGNQVSFIVDNGKHNWFRQIEIIVPPAERDSVVKYLADKNVPLSLESSFWLSLQYRPVWILVIFAGIFWGIGIGIWIWQHNNQSSPSGVRTMNYQNGGTNNVNQARAGNPGTYEEEEDKLTFDDVAGIDEVKDQIVEIVNLFKDSSKISAMGGKIPRGILLNGPPGTGKTLLAKVTASECGANFIAASGSDFVEMYVGVGARRIRDLFHKAKALAPCIIFIDEIDAVGGRRGHDNNSEREQTLNQLLTEMDGFDGRNNILVFAATNQIDKLDPALLRPGRFDRQVQVHLPDAGGREKILDVYIKKTKVDNTVNIEEIARATSGFSGADLANLINEAILRTVRLNKTKVSHKDILAAKDKIIMGAERKLKYTEEEKYQTAVHEIGHALVGHHLKVGQLVNVSIVPRGRALGVTQMEAEDMLTLSKDQACNQLAMLLGGRVAEQVFFQRLTTGAANDIERVHNLTRTMVTSWGMGNELGPMGFTADAYRFLSEKTKITIDEEIFKIIRDAEKCAHDIIFKNKKLVELIAQRLVAKENISAKEFANLVSKGV